MRIKTAMLALVTLAASALPLTACAGASTKSASSTSPACCRKRRSAGCVAVARKRVCGAPQRTREHQRDLKAREDKLQKDGATMAEAERRNPEKTLRDGQRELARKQNEFLEDLNVPSQRGPWPAAAHGARRSAGLRQERRLDVVVCRRALLRARQSIITGQVLTALQSKNRAPAHRRSPEATAVTRPASG
jgi:outer membrane protein